ncbi:nucleotidyltransferase domain-containing protein [Microbacterium sp. LWH3-1.2]|uniref:nucleotidyltransferase domain-containing protein n=1 Tax=Microbacterium sp. LWH3-1.2 TaxID=3135256 RepID=UPI003445C8BF
MRAIPDSLDAVVVAEIDRRLESVAAEHGVRVPWAIESGSRAWGFPSPDSDYDCRFLFVGPRERYLTLWPGRDVIETPLDDVFDVNGWDLPKALTLIARGNATAVEWLRSPIVYGGDTAFRRDLLTYAAAVVERSAIARHYLHVARRQQKGAQTLKRFFYVLRPAAALRWLADHPDDALPPMDLPTLLSETTVPDEIRGAAAELITLKSVTRELGSGKAPTVLRRFAARELERAGAFESMAPEKNPGEVRERADEVFRRIVG